MRKETIKEVVKFLKKRNWSIGVMESCTGGAMMDSITNIPGVSEVFFGGRVTYSDKDKIEAGVNKDILKKYGVYSEQMVMEMVRVTKGDIAIGITGNLPGKVFWGIRFSNIIENGEISVSDKNKDEVEARMKMKQKVVEEIYRVLKNLVDLSGGE